LRVIQLAVNAATLGNANAITDAGSAAALGQAALSGAGYNVRINALSLPPEEAQPMLDELKAMDARAAKFQAQLKSILAERGGFSLE
jgi:glutamate formiminotransferase/formiminotetrahydrofolate cyclodeaminase